MDNHLRTQSIVAEAGTRLEHMCRMEFVEPVDSVLQTRIICTISRSSRKLELLEKMILDGMRIVRLNFAHESHEHHAETIDLLHQATENCNKKMGYRHHVAIALDTKGPVIRTGLIENNNEVELKKNDNLRLSINKDLMDKGNKECIYVDYPNIINVTQPGNRVFINDGAITLIVKEVAVDCLICQVEVGGIMGSRKGVCLPGVPVDLPPVSEKDRFDLKFGIEHNVDFVFASKIRNASAIREIRGVLGSKGKDIKIITKIENMHGLLELDELIAVSDGILYARGDLGVELPGEKVFLAQKAILARCNRAGKPVIVGTQLLETMRYHYRPTRAEIADLGNIVLDGADCVMLSSESAIGIYPTETLQMMANVCREAERAVWHRNLFQDLLARNPAMLDAAHAIAISAVDASNKALAKAIIVLTTSGRSAHLISKYRPRCPILAVTRCARTARQANLHRGVFPMLFVEPFNEDWIKDIDLRVQYGLNIAKKMNVVETGDAVIVVSQWKDGAGFTNNMRVLYAFYEKEAFECILKKDVATTQKIVRQTIDSDQI